MISCREPNEKNIENIEQTKFFDFLEEIKEDYQNDGAQLRTALNKFEERYKSAKLKSIPRLVTFLYDLNGHLDPTVNIRSGSMIRVQVESVKRRKTEGSGCRRKLSSITKNKENLDPQIIPSQKKECWQKGTQSEQKHTKNQLN